MKNWFCIVCFCISLSIHAQERCGFALGQLKRERDNPSWIRQKAEFEYKIREFNKENSLENKRIEAKVYKIPVVVHVIHNNASNVIGGANNVNISDEQIASQIRVLNEDYRKKTGTNGFNTSPVGSDMELEFELATKDPNGNVTNGITRTLINNNGYDITEENQTIAKLIKWDYERYLNIWVVRSRNGIIGYSTFPYDSKLNGLETTQQDLDAQKIFDGVIIDYRNFGTCCGTLSNTYNLGRTLTHEIGHWLGLLHPTADTRCGDDFCDDTPQIESLNLNTSCVKLTSNCTGTSIANMIENFMDYSPDRCMNIFTNDQKKRSRAALELSQTRKRFINNLEPLPETDVLTISTEPNPIKESAFLKTQFKGQKNVVLSVYDFRGFLIYEENYPNTQSNYFSIKTDKLRTGEYIVRVQAGEEIKSQKIVVFK
jgi:hypothetical protein